MVDGRCGVGGSCEPVARGEECGACDDGGRGDCVYRCAGDCAGGIGERAPTLGDTDWACRSCPCSWFTVGCGAGVAVERDSSGVTWKVCITSAVFFAALGFWSATGWGVGVGAGAGTAGTGVGCNRAGWGCGVGAEVGIWPCA